MNSHLFSSSSPFLSLVCFIWVIFVRIQSSSSNPYSMYESCKIKFQCGNITAGYPFWGEAHQGPSPWGCIGHPELKLNCEGKGDVATIMINEVKYRVLDIKWKEQTMRIARMDYLELEGICSPAFPNTTVNSELFEYSDGYENVTFLYDCPPSFPVAVSRKYIPCSYSKGVEHYRNWSMKAGGDDPGNCNASVFFPVPKNSLNWKAITDDHLVLRQVLDQGFELKWKLRGIPCEDCTNSKGTCGWDYAHNETNCFCPNQPAVGFPNACPNQPAGTQTSNLFL
ncbi:hypothetical protein Dsin_032558 [Dipteronia sinensis]|uniref:non-specific serine/threonine protein kinase n=1 Tax=Dipteronia sinensis TaxID=43782 RepID=A0AAD9ZBU8_9ROSI|nr:hypothetical protein Dsin_032558 [Dipteronia sinensis]